MCLVAVFGIFLYNAAQLTTSTAENEKTVTVDELPEVVRTAVRHSLSPTQVHKIVVTDKSGGPEYEVEAEIQGVEVELCFDADGKLSNLEIDKTYVVQETSEESEETEDNESRSTESSDDDDDDDDASEDRVIDNGSSASDTTTSGSRSIPLVVVQALLRHLGVNGLCDIAADLELGEWMYSATTIVDGRSTEVTVTTDGELTETSTEIASDSVPLPVQRAARQQLVKSGDIRFEKKCIVVYEAETEHNGSNIDVLLLPSGKTIKIDIQPRSAAR